MARFSDILKGKRARRTVRFPALLDRGSLLPPPEKPSATDEKNSEAVAPRDVQGEAPQGAQEPPILVDLVVLTGEEEARVCRQASEFARAHGSEGAKPGDPIYDLGIMVYTLLIGVIDHESPEDDPRPFFDSADQILKHLDRERIVHLYTLHEVWQDECAPARTDLTESELYAWVLELADSEDPQVPFGRLRPGSLWIYMRSLARLLVSFLELRSQPGSPSDTGTTRSTASRSESELPAGQA